MGLFKPGWYSKNESKAEKAVQQIHDPQKLRSIVLDQCVTLYARLTAAKQLEDDEMLIYLQKNAGDELTERRASDALRERRMAREEQEELALLETTDDLGTVLRLYLKNDSNYTGGSSLVRARAIARMGTFSEEDYCRYVLDTPVGWETASRQKLALKQIQSVELLDRIADAFLGFEITDPKTEKEERALKLSKWEAEKLQKEAREKAAELRHTGICNGKHDWETVSREDTTLGEGEDYRLIYERRRCKRCGETKGEYFWPDGTPFIKPKKGSR